MITAAPPMAVPLVAPVEQSPPELATRLPEPTWTGPAWSARAGGAARGAGPAARPAGRAGVRGEGMGGVGGGDGARREAGEQGEVPGDGHEVAPWSAAAPGGGRGGLRLGSVF